MLNLFISFSNEVKTECNNFKPDKNLYVLKFVGYLIWGLQRTELWAVVVALYGFCQGGENKRYVLSIAPTTTYMVHYFHFENGERTCKWNHLSCWPQALFLWDNRMATLLLSWACLPLLFSLSQRCYSALLWWEKMLDWVLIFHIDQIAYIEYIFSFELICVMNISSNYLWSLSLRRAFHLPS